LSDGDNDDDDDDDDEEDEDLQGNKDSDVESEDVESVAESVHGISRSSDSDNEYDEDYDEEPDNRPEITSMFTEETAPDEFSELQEKDKQLATHIDDNDYETVLEEAEV
jgi:hypothetical protein